VDLSHLVRVEVIGIFPIVSVTGYTEQDEPVFDGDQPRFDADGQLVTQPVRVPMTEDVDRGGFAFLDPAETNIRALVRAQLVKLAPLPAKVKAGAR